MAIRKPLGGIKSKSIVKPALIELGPAWLSIVDTLTTLIPIFGDIVSAKNAIAGSLRAGKLRAFARELSIINAGEWDQGHDSALSRAKRLDFVHKLWLGPYPDSVALTPVFWKQSPHLAMEMPMWDWQHGHFVSGMFRDNLDQRNDYWIARSIALNAFEVECLGERRRLGQVFSVEGDLLSIPPKKKVGRPVNAKWSDWVAEWVFYCRKNELSKDLDPADLAAAIDQKLKERKIGRIDRRPAEAAIQTTLNYICTGTGKSQKSGFPE